MDVLEEGDGKLAQHCSHPKTKLGDMLVFIMAFKSKWVGLTKLLMVGWVDLAEGELVDGMVAKLVRQVLLLCSFLISSSLVCSYLLLGVFMLCAFCSLIS